MVKFVPCFLECERRSAHIDGKNVCTPHLPHARNSSGGVRSASQTRVVRGIRARLAHVQAPHSPQRRASVRRSYSGPGGCQARRSMTRDIPLWESLGRELFVLFSRTKQSRTKPLRLARSRCGRCNTFASGASVHAPCALDAKEGSVHRVAEDVAAQAARDFSREGFHVPPWTGHTLVLVHPVTGAGHTLLPHGVLVVEQEHVVQA